MKLFLTACLALALFAGLAVAAGIDGKWVSERKMERDGQSFTITQTFDLKSEGNKLTGKLDMQFGDQEPRSVEIQDGKIDGEKFSFNTVMTTPNGEMKIAYSGSVEGDTLKGASQREGGGQSRPFEAKRK
jgi:hypothetical protein